MNTLLKFSTKISYIFLLLVAVSFSSCEDETDLLPKISAEFTYTLNQDTGVVTFLNTSENATNYSWDFGDENTSTEINPTKQYPNGTYTVTLVAKNVAGATDTFTSEVSVLIPEIASLPLTFDGENTTYEPELFNGTSFSVVDNPSATGANATTSKVGKITNSGNAFEGIAFNLGAPISLATDKSLKLLVWSDKTVPVLVKLEQGNAFTETAVNHGGTGWETLYFTFDSDATFGKLTLFMDGPGSTAGDFFIDDIMQIATDAIPCQDTELKAPIDFECEGIDYATKIIGNVSFEVVDNPELSGIKDTASKVGKIVNVGANWENAFFNLDTPVDFSTDKGIKVNLFSNQALPIKIKFEGGTADPVEADVNHTGSGWEELTFSFTSDASYSSMVVFVDGPGTAAGTFYIDDIMQVAVAPPPAPFDGGLITNGGFDAATAAPWSIGTTSDLPPVITDASGNTHYSVDVTTAGDSFSVNLSQLGLNLTEGKTYKITYDAWGSARDIIVGIGLSSDPWTNKTEVQAITETRETYTHELVANFTNANSRVIFDLGAAVGLVNIDNVRLEEVATTPPANADTTLIVDFENNLANITATEFETGGALIANPVSGGINTSANVYEVTHSNANQWWGGIGLLVGADKLNAAATEYKVKMYSTIAPTNVLFEVEIDGTNQPVGQVQEITTANEWVELTFTLPTASQGVNRVLVRPDVGDKTGTKPNSGTLYIDDIQFVNVSTTGGGGSTGSCPAPPAGDLIADGTFEANAGCWLFNDGTKGGTTSLSTTINNGGSNSGQITTAALDNPGLKQERFAIGTVLPNTTYVVTFDVIASQPLADGAVFQAFTFSEPAEGSNDGAAQHVLVQGLANVANTWETKSYEFTTAANVDGGLSLLFELVCGGAATCGGTVNIDNVSIVKK